MRIVEPPPPA